LHVAGRRLRTREHALGLQGGRIERDEEGAVERRYSIAAHANGHLAQRLAHGPHRAQRELSSHAIEVQVHAVDAGQTAI